MNNRITIASLACIVVALTSTECLAETTITITIDVDRGGDRGQNFGSLFEATTADGKYIFGAGFSGLYNTYYRDDRHSIQCYIRPAAGDRPLAASKLPRPNDIAGTYLFNSDGNVFAANPEIRQWNEPADRWDSVRDKGRIETRVGNHLLSFQDGTVLLDERLVLDRPKEGNYTGFYYAQGYLFFYHIYKPTDEGYRLYSSDADGYSKIYACPWEPGDGDIKLTEAVIETIPVVGEFPYAYGQLENQVLSCSNIGGAYAFRDGTWRTVVEGDLKTSYQVYTMITYYDQLLLGQYPTGELFAFDGETVKQISGWPPRMDGVSGSSREAQSMAIYAGDLYVGVWPWGELWRYHRESQSWSLAKRMFTHPNPTAATTHPYEEECAALGGVANQWGQRVTSLVTHRDAMLVSTSAKWPCPWEPKFEFVANGKWKEYGDVTRVHVPGHLSAPAEWTEGSTQFSIELGETEARVFQEGRLLGTIPYEGALADLPTSLEAPINFEWGRGAFGRFIGEQRHRVRSTVTY